MSTDNISAFLAKSETDTALAAQIRAIHEQAAATLAADLARLSQEAGTPFTAEEFLANQSQALSDAELEAVSGGKVKSGWSFLVGPCWTSEQERFQTFGEHK